MCPDLAPEDFEKANLVLLGQVILNVDKSAVFSACYPLAKCWRNLSFLLYNSVLMRSDDIRLFGSTMYLLL